MHHYPIFLYVHIVSAMGFFATLTLEWASLERMRRSTSRAEVHEWLHTSRGVIGMGLACVAALGASGGYLMLTNWDRAPWLTVSVGSLVPLVVLATAVSRRRLHALGRLLLAEKEAVSVGIRGQLRHPALLLSVRLRVAIALGVAFVMTVKPDFGGAVQAMVTALLCGLLSVVVTLGLERGARFEPAPERSAALERKARQLVYAALAVLAATAVHHVYGALLYDTPFRLHVVIVAAVVVPLIVGARRLFDARSDAPSLAVLAGATLIFPVALIGGFEGVYNHVAKNVLYFAGAPQPLLTKLFPPPTYELPNDLVFEVTGILQVVPAVLTAFRFAETYRSWRRSILRPNGGHDAHAAR